MAEGVTVGLTTTRRIEIDRARCIDHMGDDLAVYSTPNMLNDVELTCHELIAAHLPDTQSTVGTHVDMQHIAPSLEGDSVEITATVTAVEGRAVSFETTVRDSIEDVGRVKHNRFIVDQDKTLARLTAKREQLKAG
jgi:fluoroacetyl-CoA thioesterase